LPSLLRELSEEGNNKTKTPINKKKAKERERKHRR
jgi:hypothetical protein